ncbi:MAG: hypothetical protein HC936_04255 [Leptolyngbyaceae cyanobacterium SU_3_3]|nr:hypothetical protein [Leptolyngbyaceae cyanobacterium SU_3_3]
MKGVFGAIKFTLSGVFKLIYRGAILAIVLTILVWAVPRLLDLVPQLADSLDSSNPKTKIPPELRHGDYLEQRCQELGLDYREFVRSVNEKFYTRYPDRRGKLLSDNQQDKALREEWYAIAQELLEKSGKPSDRNSLKEVAETQ